MSLAGFMKQINKANQLISEKIGGAKGTELDTSFHQMEKVSLFISTLLFNFDSLIKKTDVINKLIDEIKDKTNEFLQPNPGIHPVCGCTFKD